MPAAAAAAAAPVIGDSGAREPNFEFYTIRAPSIMEEDIEMPVKNHLKMTVLGKSPYQQQQQQQQRKLSNIFHKNMIRGGKLSKLLFYSS